MKDFVIKPGLYTQFKCGQRAEGLHLNRLIEDVMRENGYPTKSSDCTQPDLCELVAPCLTEIPGGNGVTEFTELTDTPNNYTGGPGSVVSINSTSTGLSYGPIVVGDLSYLGTFSTVGPGTITTGVVAGGGSRVRDMTFGNWRVTASGLSNGTSYDINVTIPTNQSNLGVSIISPVINALAFNPANNTSVPITIRSNGVSGTDHLFTISFTATGTGIQLNVSIIAGA